MILILINVIGAILAYYLLHKTGCDENACLGGALIFWPLGILLWLIFKLTDREEWRAGESVKTPEGPILEPDHRLNPN